MRMSCNGCRVLRKGCSIRPCLEWIKNPQFQANATVFLAKFYGRAGLSNLINAGPHHLRPAIFRSLLYVACGRVVNPIYGSVGLLWSGNWSLCQNAVEAVLQGAPITQITNEAAETNDGPPLKSTYDFRHFSKDGSSSGSGEIHLVNSRPRFKRSAVKSRENRVDESGHDEFNRPTSHESALSHESAPEPEPDVDGDNRESESLASAENAEDSVLYRAEPEFGTEFDDEADDSEVQLELTLGFEPASRSRVADPKRNKTGCDSSDDGACKMDLRLDYAATL